MSDQVEALAYSMQAIADRYREHADREARAALAPHATAYLERNPAGQVETVHVITTLEDQ